MWPRLREKEPGEEAEAVERQRSRIRMRLWAKGQARGKGKDGAGSLSLRVGTGGTGSTPKDRGKRGSLLSSLEDAGPSLRKSSGLIYTKTN